MTSLIDVIFLLLLFFMLSSTFSQFSDVELASAGTQGAGASETAPMFLQLGQEELALNTQPVTLDALSRALTEQRVADKPLPVLVSVSDDVTAQRLTDLLVILNGTDGVQPTLLGGS